MTNKMTTETNETLIFCPACLGTGGAIGDGVELPCHSGPYLEPNQTISSSEGILEKVLDGRTIYIVKAEYRSGDEMIAVFFDEAAALRCFENNKPQRQNDRVELFVENLEDMQAHAYYPVRTEEK